MELINSIYLHSLRNNEHFQFMTDVKNSIETATPAALGLEPVYRGFKTKYNRLNAALAVDRGSTFTEKINDSDEKRDRYWSAVNGRLTATLHCPIAEEVEAAKALKRIFDLYGNVRKMSYNEETAALTNLTEDYEKPKNAAHCQTVGITHWVAGLKQENKNTQELINARNAELANKESGDVKAERAGIDPEYNKIVERLNAMATLDMASPEAQDFIRQLNQRIIYYNDTLAAREGRNASEKNEDTPAVPE